MAITVQMWISHGFVGSKDEEQIEDTGSRYFNDLVQRSFFQSSISNNCHVMHDLFNDLARSIAGGECFNGSDSKQQQGFHRKARHLSLNLQLIGSANFEKIYELRDLRTLLLTGGNWKWTSKMFNCLKFLRVLKLQGCDMPDCIGNLSHLRYLKFENNTIKELPESICRIYNLQTLILTNCNALVKLPNGMNKLRNLRHLQLDFCSLLESMPLGIGRLNRLQTLSVFIVGREVERGREELKNLTDLRGSLKVRNLERVENVEAAYQANLKSKPFINELELRWSDRWAVSSIDERYEEEVAEWLQPHPNVKKLYFEGYMGTHFPSWMMKSGMDMLLPHLTHVSLNGCRRCNILPPLGQLPFLVHLSIKEMDEVKHIAEGQFFRLQCLNIYNCPQLTSLPHFPSLEQLYLERLDNLEDWCGVGEDEFRNLRLLELTECPKLTKWPTNLSALSKLNISECLGFDSFPHIPSLSSLTIGESNDKLLKSVASLTSLSSLISTSTKLTAVPGGILKGLTQLKRLSTLCCYKLGEFPDMDELPPTLNFFGFCMCDNLKSLPRGLHTFASLRHLVISGCPLLQALPDEGLPIGLQMLIISDPLKLEERCSKDTGEDWPKISHIPLVSVGGLTY